MNELLEETIELRHQLHTHPQLSLNERETIERLMCFLHAHCVNTEIHDCGTWFYTVKKGTSSKKIAFRGDMDALPIDEHLDLSYCSVNEGISHKCGHDGHSSTLAYLVCLVDRLDTKASVYGIFQHAEEIGVGGDICSNLLTSEHIDEVYAYHNLPGFPAGKLVYRRGLSQPASVGITIKATGTKSHASYPEQGNNPSGFFAGLIEKLSRIDKKAHKGIVLCTIVNVSIGTKDFGISAGEGELSFTLRAENEDEMLKEQKIILNYAKRVAARQNLKLEVKESDRFPETRNHDDCLDRVIEAAHKCEVETEEMNYLWRASEDFGNYLKKCPGAIFYMGNGTHSADLHTSGYDFNDTIILPAAKVMLEIIKSHDDD